MKKIIILTTLLSGYCFAQNIEFSNVNPLPNSGYMLPGASVYSINKDLTTGEKNITISPIPGVYMSYKPGTPTETKPNVNNVPKEIENKNSEQELAKKIEAQLWEKIKANNNPKSELIKPKEFSSSPNSSSGSNQSIKTPPLNQDVVKQEEKPMFIYSNDISSWNKDTIKQYEQNGNINLQKQYEQFLYQKQ